MKRESKIWLITGISRGLGRVLAQTLLARGDTVIGTTRSGTSDLAPGMGRLAAMPLELTDPRAVKETVAAAFALHGRVDVIVNNAGAGLLGSIEEATEDDIEQVFAVNFHGPRRLIQAALAPLRAQRGGQIVNITSMAAISPNPGVGYYGAAKAALEGLSHGLAKEVAPLGIRVMLVEPSAFRTEFLSDRSIRRNASRLADYASTVGASLARLDAMAGNQAGDPARAAAAIIAAVESPTPPLHLVLGSNAYIRARKVVDDFAAELEAWKGVAMDADYCAGSKSFTTS